MPAEMKLLFRPEAVRPQLKGFVLPAISEALSRKLANWSNLLGSKQAEAMKETELLADFIRDVFVDLQNRVQRGLCDRCEDEATLGCVRSKVGGLV